MTAWTSNEINKIGAAEELRIAGLRKDGTLHSYRTIWVVRVDNDLYVRSVNGRTSDWFRGILTRRAGCVQSGGIVKDAIFEEVNDTLIHEKIDAAYYKKYNHYPKAYVDACVTPQAHAATLKLVPLSAK